MHRSCFGLEKMHHRCVIDHFIVLSLRILQYSHQIDTQLVYQGCIRQSSDELAGHPWQLLEHSVGLCQVEVGFVIFDKRF